MPKTGGVGMELNADNLLVFGGDKLE